MCISPQIEFIKLKQIFNQIIQIMNHANAHHTRIIEQLVRLMFRTEKIESPKSRYQEDQNRAFKPKEGTSEV